MQWNNFPPFILFLLLLVILLFTKNRKRGNLSAPSVTEKPPKIIDPSPLRTERTTDQLQSVRTGDSFHKSPYRIVFILLKYNSDYLYFNEWATDDGAKGKPPKMMEESSRSLQPIRIQHFSSFQNSEARVVVRFRETQSVHFNEATHQHSV